MKNKYPKIGRVMRERAGYTQGFLVTLLVNIVSHPLEIMRLVRARCSDPIC